VGIAAPSIYATSPTATPSAAACRAPSPNVSIVAASPVFDDRGRLVGLYG